MTLVGNVLFEEVHDHCAFIKRPWRIVVVQSKCWDEALWREFQQLFRLLVRVDFHFRAALDMHRLPLSTQGNGLTILSSAMHQRRAVSELDIG